jgi:hypothetical protein
MSGGIFTISLDFELHWGIRDHAEIESHTDQLLGARRAIPAILDQFRTHSIHATWATVGFLFFRSRSDLIAGLPARQPAYVCAELSPYCQIDSIGHAEADDPFHYAPTLIEQIRSTPDQEIASHTFSHYYCMEAGQTLSDFTADLRAAQNIAETYGCKLESLVFPRNQINAAYLSCCRELGITAYRGNEHIWFYQSKNRAAYNHPLRRIFRLLDAYINISGANSYPLPRRDTLPINIPSSRYLRPYSKRFAALEPIRLRRITTAMEIAARSDHIFHLWWHPEQFGVHTDENLASLTTILAKYKELQTRYGMRSRSMKEIARQG